ncbi:hypothetical protein [Lacrimispora sp.]|uniref:hypothetical protein n=1 Tax=Lacrimispora sp. TaxID=2719234 RepID=UPI00346146D0
MKTSRCTSSDDYLMYSGLCFVWEVSEYGVIDLTDFSRKFPRLLDGGMNRLRL